MSQREAHLECTCHPQVELEMKRLRFTRSRLAHYIWLFIPKPIARNVFFFFISTVNKVGGSSDWEESRETSVGTNRLAIPFPLEGAVDRIRRIVCDVPSYRSSCCGQRFDDRYGAKGYSVGRLRQLSATSSSQPYNFVIPRDFSPLATR